MTNGEYDFNKILDKIIEKSSFTKRNIEIILSKNHRQLQISSGAYYKQKSQIKQKTESLMYSIVLLQVLNLLPEGSLYNMEKISESVKVILDSDISENSDVMSLLDEIVRRSVVI